jgi:NAD+-dependent protein deacetylase sirtuin 4
LQQIDTCDGVLVVGSSLEVFSAYRFVDRAATLTRPIAIVNMGETRAERAGLRTIQYKSEANCAVLLQEVADRVLG